MTDAVYCGKCGTQLDEPLNLHTKERQPCEKCGSVARRRDKVISGEGTVIDASPAEINTVAQPSTARASGSGTIAAVGRLEAEGRAPAVRAPALEIRLMCYLPTDESPAWLMEVTDSESDGLVSLQVNLEKEPALLNVIEDLVEILPPDHEQQ